MPPHLRGSGYAGATRLGHGDGYVYAHDEADGVAQQDYLPDDLQGKTDYYRPTDRGFEERLGPRWEWLKSRIRGRPDRRTLPRCARDARTPRTAACRHGGRLRVRDGTPWGGHAAAG